MPWLKWETGKSPRSSFVDTVGTKGMTIPPFEPRVEGNRVYGRGSYDMKGGAAAVMLRLLLSRTITFQVRFLSLWWPMELLESSCVRPRQARLLVPS
jgi:hypothetical protein